jgi:hypothetical protein
MMMGGWTDTSSTHKQQPPSGPNPVERIDRSIDPALPDLNPTPTPNPDPLEFTQSHFQHSRTPIVCSSGYRMAMAAAGGADGFEGPRRKVLVTGAAGRTGSLVFKKLQAKPGAYACMCVYVC